MIESNFQIMPAYPLTGLSEPVIDRLAQLAEEAGESQLSDADLWVNLGQLVANKATTEIEVAPAGLESPLVVGSATLNVVGSVEGMRGMVSGVIIDGSLDEQGDPLYRKQGHATRLLQAVHAGLLARNVSEVFAVVDDDNAAAQQLFKRAEYEQDANAVVLERSADVPIDDRQLRTTTRVRMRDRRANGDGMSVDDQTYQDTLQAITNLRAGVRITSERIRRGNGQEAAVIASLAQLISTRQMWIDAQGSPETVRGLIYELDNWNRQEHQGATSFNAVVPADSTLLASYEQLGFSRRDASVYRRNLSATA
jgi:ribosomal protein S18 acetylase RimI-like enzyme